MKKPDYFEWLVERVLACKVYDARSTIPCGTVVQLLRREHARVVREIKTGRARMAKVKAVGHEARIYQAGALQACDDLLAALATRRGKGGR